MSSTEVTPPEIAYFMASAALICFGNFLVFVTGTIKEIPEIA
jgi:hypothetical protein